MTEGEEANFLHAIRVYLSPYQLERYAFLQDKLRVAFMERLQFSPQSNSIFANNSGNGPKYGECSP
jgi:hypothetical protein